VELQSQPLPPEYRFVLSSKLEQAAESGDAALVTAGLLTTGMIVGLRLMHASVPATVALALPMMLSGVVGYLYCRRRARALRRDIEDGTIVVGTALAKLTRLEGKAEGSYALQLPDRRVGAFSKRAGLRSILVRPDAGSFAGVFAYAPCSGQLLRLSDRTGRSIFDAAAAELDETFDFSELSDAA
jgi:hypothetical protein